MLPLHDIPSDQAKLLQGIGEVAFRWNDLEAMARLILYFAIDVRGYRVDCVTAHLQNVALTESLKAVSVFTPDETVGEHIRHFAKAFDIARPYRNHCVHGPRMIGHDKKMGLVGFGQDFVAKGGKLRMRSGEVTCEMLADFNAYLFTLRDYTNQICSAMRPGSPMAIDSTSLEMPPLLEPLSLRLTPIEEQQPPPPPSPQ